jgi:hypothetical protein
LKPERLAHRADPEGRVSEKWIRFSGKNDAPTNIQGTDLKDGERLASARVRPYIA